MVNALVGIEDSRYWEHGAIDLRGTIRAAVNDLQHKPVQGGSTIAQQYVKNVLLLEAELANNTQAVQAADAATLSRKLNELRMAVAAEHQQSKQDIVAGYLNDAYFGNNAYGIETAAETYFDTTAAKLSVTQAATLAGIVENPSCLRPDPASRDGPPAAQSRAGPDGRDQQRAHRGAGHGRRGQAARPAGLDTRERLPVQFGGLGRVLLPVRGRGLPARPGLRQDAEGQGQAALHRRPEDLHHAEPADQQAANNAVNYVEPGNSNYWNPGRNADTEAVVQPGTGQIEAIAEDRPYGPGRGQTEIDYAVNTAYGGSTGVQTGSSSKLFTLITALKQGTPFGFSCTVPGSTTVTGYTNCQGGPAGVYQGQAGRDTTCRTRKDRSPPRPTRSTPGRRSRSTCSTPSSRRRSACATSSTPPSTWE